MKMRNLISITAAAGICLACENALSAVYAPPPGNLIVNGSFENGLTGWFGTYGTTAATPNTVSGSFVGIIIDIGHSSVGMTMTQTIGTTPGAMYALSLGLRLPELNEYGVPISGNSSGDSDFIDVRWNGQTAAIIPVVSRDWAFHTLQLTATSSDSTLNFYNFNGPGHQAWPFIDGVSMVAIPEPSTAGFSVVFLLVAAFFGAERRLRCTQRT